MSPLRVLVVGCGNMGASHARAYHRMPTFAIVGLVSRRPESRKALSAQLGGLPTFEDYRRALAATKPDVVSINTYSDTHAPYAEKAIAAGCHVFCEKPLAETVEQAERIVRLATMSGRKLVVGYILRVHPVWMRFVQIAQTLGKPLVMRLNLNQRSHGAKWATHRHLMESMSPVVDCGVHYVDVMQQMTGAKPIRVSAIGARLTEDIVPGRCNYGQLQVTFDDGSLGWYEAGWGPMMSETAYFIKDVIGPGGSVSIVRDLDGARSDDIQGHTRTDCLRLHRSDVDANGEFLAPDEIIRFEDEPDHHVLCEREQAFLLRAITEDLDLSEHLRSAVDSLRIVLAAEESIRSGRTIHLAQSPKPKA